MKEMARTMPSQRKVTETAAASPAFKCDTSVV
jgi:hypothetical protein